MIDFHVCSFQDTIATCPLVLTTTNGFLIDRTLPLYHLYLAQRRIKNAAVHDVGAGAAAEGRGGFFAELYGSSTSSSDRGGELCGMLKQRQR